MAAHYIRWFDEIGIGDVALVGGKNASLGELYRELTKQGVNVPNGFATTAEAYWDLLRGAALEEQIRFLLNSLDTQNPEKLRQAGQAVRAAIAAATDIASNNAV